MSTDIQKANLPVTPFDGQEFIDFRRIKWKFNKALNCWTLIGPVPEVPLATTEASGLLQKADKVLLDSLPPKGGGFGILAQPLLSVVPIRRTALYKGTVKIAGETPAGSKVESSSAALTSDAYAGKMIYFTKGVLKDQYFLIFTNDENTFYVMGKDASVAAANDKFEIYEAASINENGVIQGPIELVSETLDITCVDGNGNPVDSDCNVNHVFVDDPANPPGLDLRVGEKFKKQFCVVQPGAAGSRGDIGDKGKQGAHGTGDGPTGDQGLAGLSAPEIGDEFTGIKLIDLDDIYDTAVVAMELDADGGKLHVIKAKIRTPDDTKPADQIIASAISRDVRFTNAEFEYELLMPSGDPIDIADVEIMHYPQGFTPRSDPTNNRPETTEANVIKLTSIVDAIVGHYESELDRIGRDIDENQIKPYIEEKDQQARVELNARADEVARCEWDMPIEFCLGITPENCEPGDTTPKPMPVAAEILGPEWKDAVGVPLPQKKVPATPVPPPTGSSGDGSDPVPPPPPPPSGPPTTPSTPYYPTTNDSTTSIQYNSRVDYPEDNPGAVVTPRDAVWFDSRGRHESTASHTYVDVSNVDGGSTLDGNSAYIALYGGGAGRSNASTWTAAVSVSYADQDGNSGTVYMQDSPEGEMSFDRSSFINSQFRAGASTGAGFVLSSSGEAQLNLFIEGDTAEGEVDVHMFQVFRDALSAPMPVTQTMNRAPDGSGGMAMVSGFSGELDCPECPDCISDVDCGDNVCPDCLEPVAASASSPDDGPPGTTITIDGSGFGPAEGAVYFESSAGGGSPSNGTVSSWSNTQIVVDAPDVGVLGAVDMTVIRTDAEESKFPNMYEQTI